MSYCCPVKVSSDREIDGHGTLILFLGSEYICLFLRLKKAKNAGLIRLCFILCQEGM